jgi:D-3-phosphoglycerate dehydrogenase / 2-oxoglutarate reductase
MQGFQEYFSSIKPIRILVLDTAPGIAHAIASELKKSNSKLAGVAFDVFEHEGANFQSPLIGCKNAILTPHIAGTTNAALSSSAIQMVENIHAILSGYSPFLANPDLLKKQI